MLALTALVPPAGEGPVVLHVESAALAVAVVDRGKVKRLNESWDKTGVYLLLQRTNDNNHSKAYVGKATGLRKRLINHERVKTDWERAILVTRDTSHGFNSAQAGWLEGRLWELVNDLPDVELDNKQRPTDDTLRAFDVAALEQLILPIERIMLLLGFTQGKASEGDIGARSKRTLRQHGVSISDLVAAGDLAEGTILTPVMPRYTSSAIIQADGSLACEGKIYPSPSSAGRAVRGGTATNGWTFWQLADGRTLADVRSEHPAK